MAQQQKDTLAKIIDKEFQNAADAEEYQRDMYQYELKAYMAAMKELRKVKDEQRIENFEGSENNGNAPVADYNVKNKILHLPNKLAKLLQLAADVPEMMLILSSHFDMLDAADKNKEEDPQTSFRKMRLVTFALTWLRELHGKHLTKFIVPYEHKRMLQNLVQWDLSFVTCKQIVDKCVQKVEDMFGAERTREETYAYRILSNIGAAAKGFVMGMSVLRTGADIHHMLDGHPYDVVPKTLELATMQLTSGFPTVGGMTATSLKNDEERGRYHYIPAPAKGSLIDKHVVSRETFLRKPAPGSVVDRREREQAYKD